MFTMHPKVHELAASLVHGSDIGHTYYMSELFSFRYVLATDYNSWPKELSTELSERLRALRCVGGSKIELLDDVFVDAIWLRVLELKEQSMQKLPSSICKLRHLGYLNLSGCSRLENLPESFGDLLQLLHIDLSGCSRLETFPESFGDLLQLLHMDLSGCSCLVSLPESFGKLINIAYIDLSGCSKLEKLPDSIVKLLKLVHIDLAGCSALVKLPVLLWKLSDLEHINLSGCSALENLPRSFGKLGKLVYMNLSGCSKLVKLPQSFVKLVNLTHLNLSGCTGLAKLPGSFGKLINLTHINLSGCSRLRNIPESFGRVTKLEHIDLSGCSGLVTLPDSFGCLTDLWHVNLSRCHGLSKLPQSFSKLQNLQHLDLSFWSCFGVIRKALVGRSNLQHLNLSHPCCSAAQNNPDPQGLKQVLSQLTSLQYLNLSRFLNPMLDSMSEAKNQVVLKEKEEEIGGYFECISGLSSLQHLDLSQNLFLRDVPECLGDLNNMHTLDLSGCIRLKTVPQKIYEMDCLKLIVLKHCRNLESYQFVVGADNSRGNFAQLEYVNCQEMEISCLEKVKSVAEARSIRLKEKGHLVKLKLCWTLGSQQYVVNNALLEEVVPPQSLQCLELRGYWGGQSYLCRMGWWEPSICHNLLNLEEVTLEAVWTCTELPPLGLLPNLQRLVLRRITTITRIHAGDLCFGNRPALKRLSKLTIDDMPNLQAFNTRYDGVDGGEERMFPAIVGLAIINCPRLMFVPLPPRAERLVLSECNEVMFASWWTGGGRGVEGPPCVAAPVTELVVESCRVTLSDWYLLHHLFGLRSLTINNCQYLDFLPEALSSLQMLRFSRCNSITSLPPNLGDLISLRELRMESCVSLLEFPHSMQRLISLQSMHLSDCGKFGGLPEWLGQLTSLQKLDIHSCDRIGTFPESIRKLANLKVVRIWNSSGLKKWSEQEQNKEVIARIGLKYEDFDPYEPGHHNSNTNTNSNSNNTGNGGECGGSEAPLSQHHSHGSSQRPNGTRPQGPPERDIYLT